jgi:hypothetical protein
MDHPLDLEWTVVDEMDGALAGMDSPVSRPPSPQPAGPVERPVLELPHPRSPSEKARGTQHREPRPGQQHRPCPSSSPRPVQRRGSCRGLVRRGGTRWLGGRQPLTGALHKHRDFLAPSPYVGGAAFPATFAATAELPQPSSAPATGQWDCCPETAPALDPRVLIERSKRADVSESSSLLSLQNRSVFWIKLCLKC